MWYDDCVLTDSVLGIFIVAHHRNLVNQRRENASWDSLRKLSDERRWWVIDDE
jgi:hypothetical protein